MQREWEAAQAAVAGQPETSSARIADIREVLDAVADLQAKLDDREPIDTSELGDPPSP